jgi:hypothetical protein
MELRELTVDEDVVLLGWAREIVAADGTTSAPEQVRLLQLRKDLGDERVDRAIEAARLWFPDRASLRTAAARVTRPAARAAIYAFLRRLAAADSVSPREEQPLRWLAATWGLE